jgi:branched-chain amino acid transport system substrate-binding protein
MVIVFTLVIFAAMSVGQSNAIAEKKPDFKIGFTGGLSGTYAHYDLGAKAGAETAIEEINQQGGILGRQIKMYVMDDKLNPEVGLSNAKELVFSKKVDFLIGTISSGVAKAVEGFAKEVKVPYIITGAQSEHLTGKYGHRYVFRMTTNTHIYTYSDAVAAAKLNIKKWWIIAPDYEYGKACYDTFTRILKSLQPDVEFVGEGWPKLGNPDYTPYVTTIVTSEAQGLFCVLAGSDFARFVKAAKPMGLFKKMTTLGHDLGSLNTYYTLKKGMPEGIWGGTQYPFWDYKNNPRSESFYNKLTKKLKKPPALGATAGYEAVWAIESAARKADSTDVEKIIDALQGIKLDTVVGPVTIRKVDNQAMWPFVFGKTKYAPEYPNFPILANTITIKDEGYPAESDILKLRDTK